MIKEIRSYNYFNLFEVTENIYAAIKKDDLCMGNAGFINLGDRILIFDTFLSIEAAKELKGASMELTGIKEFIIINSHGHFDHFLGNCVFSKESTIISSGIVRKSILEQKNELEFGEAIYAEEIVALEKNLDTIKDKVEMLDIKNTLTIYRNFSNNECEVVPPNMTFEDKLCIYGLLENVTLRVVGKNHSPGDVICIDENKKVAFVGDLLFIDEHPYLGPGDPWNLKKELHTLANSDIEYFIPGHGSVCQKDKVIEQIEYIDAIISLVEKNLDRAEELKDYELPSKFHHYRGPYFGWNIKFLSEFYKK